MIDEAFRHEWAVAEIPWPVDSDLVVPLDQLPENLKDSMGAAWRLKVKNNKVLEEQK